jgi:transcriptional regulator with XRE-family HTH domain
MDGSWQSHPGPSDVDALDIGSVIRRARKARGLSQAELGTACGYSQSVISRIERGERQTQDLRVLAQLARRLDVPARLLGLAESSEPSVKRRAFLTSGIATTLAATVPFPSPQDEFSDVTGLRHVTGSYRRLDAVMPGRDLVEPVTAHLSMGQRLLNRTPDGEHRVRLAEAVAEMAGLAAWLAWDGANHGNARGYYVLSMKTARRSGNRLLSAYMTGSLASLAIDSGDTVEGLSLLRSARSQLGAERPATADAWLSCLEAVAHATAGEREAALSALDRAEAAVLRITMEDAPPWPWVFAFDGAKVAAHRLTCATRLRRPEAAFTAAAAAKVPLNTGHARQRALLTFDLAEAHLQGGEVEKAFSVACDALDLAAPYNSGRVADRARRLRRVVTGRVPSNLLQNFDDRLRSLSA